MKKVVLALVAAGSALAFATPAAAQYYPAPPAYGAPYGNAYGYQNNWGQVRSLQVRSTMCSARSSSSIAATAFATARPTACAAKRNQLENRLQRATRYGLNGYEANDINVRVARLEQRVQYSLANRYGNRAYAYSDRDRDGRNDRYEDDRGYRHD